MTFDSDEYFDIHLDEIVRAAPAGSVLVVVDASKKRVLYFEHWVDAAAAHSGIPGAAIRDLDESVVLISAAAVLL